MLEEKDRHNQNRVSSSSQLLPGVFLIFSEQEMGDFTSALPRCKISDTQCIVMFGLVIRSHGQF